MGSSRERGTELSSVLEGRFRALSLRVRYVLSMSRGGGTLVPVGGGRGGLGRSVRDPP